MPNIGPPLSGWRGALDENQNDVQSRKYDEGNNGKIKCSDLIAFHWFDYVVQEDHNSELRHRDTHGSERNSNVIPSDDLYQVFCTRQVVRVFPETECRGFN